MMVGVDVCLAGGERLRGGDFFFNDTATTEIYTLSRHDALPISILPLKMLGRADMLCPVASN